MLCYSGSIDSKGVQDAAQLFTRSCACFHQKLRNFLAGVAQLSGTVKKDVNTMKKINDKSIAEMH